MEPFKYHVYICKQTKPEGAPSCIARGACECLSSLEKELLDAGLTNEVQLTPCDCLGLCGKGPNLVVYPEGVWYSQVKPDDIPEIVREHLKENRPVERLVKKDPATLKQEILDHNTKLAALKSVMDKAGFLPEEANAIITGFQQSRVMLSALELDLFTAVGDGANSDKVAQKIEADPRATEALLNALVAIKVLTKKDGIFHNTKLTTRYLCEGSPDDSRSALMHIVHLWNSWSTLTEAVKEGTAISRKDITERGEDRVLAFIAAMHRNAAFRAASVVGVLDLDGVSSVLDLGGGSGAYAMAFAKRKPQLEVAVFDLPVVVSLTQKYLAEEGLAEKIKILPGDMINDPIPEDYDLVFLSAICHMWSPEQNLALFEKIRDALTPDGQIVIQDFVLDDDKTSPRFGAVFALNMLVNTEGGSSYSGGEYIEWLVKAGFKEARLLPLPGPTDLVIARKL